MQPQLIDIPQTIRCQNCGSSHEETIASPEIVPRTDHGPEDEPTMSACCSMSRGFLQAARRDFVAYVENAIERWRMRTLRDPLYSTLLPGATRDRERARELGYDQ